MKYNIIKFIMNTSNQYSASVSATFDDISKAYVNYHTTLANLHNSADVLYATVKIETEHGQEVVGYREEVDHRTEVEE